MTVLTAPDPLTERDPLHLPPAGSAYGGSGGVRSSAAHIVTLAARTIRKIRRTPEQLIDSTLQPIIFVVLFVYLFGGAVAGSRHDYLQFVIPSILAQTLVFASMTIGVNLNNDISKGVFD